MNDIDIRFIWPKKINKSHYPSGKNVLVKLPFIGVYESRLVDDIYHEVELIVENDRETVDDVPDKIKVDVDLDKIFRIIAKDILDLIHLNGRYAGAFNPTNYNGNEDELYAYVSDFELTDICDEYGIEYEGRRPRYNKEAGIVFALAEEFGVDFNEEYDYILNEVIENFYEMWWDNGGYEVIDRALSFNY